LKWNSNCLINRKKKKSSIKKGEEDEKEIIIFGFIYFLPISSRHIFHSGSIKGPAGQNGYGWLL
jgi:hypothetical protein